MSIKQVSVFIPNKQGALHTITNVLAQANIDLRTTYVADTSDYGIVRIIASEPERAVEALNNSGHTASIREVTAFAVPDVPGGLAKALDVLENNGVNIEYLYALVGNENAKGKAYTVLRADNGEKAEKVLFDNGFELLDEDKI